MSETDSVLPRRNSGAHCRAATLPKKLHQYYGEKVAFRNKNEKE
ncbi:MAG TPA: hypothetical protein VN414_13725 [Methanosarcina sp.]|nr:hypothetical protein [Methanosarcina sp.]